MKEKNNGFQINGILVLVLFGIFAVLVLMVLLTGAGAYRRLTERGQAAYTDRTIMQYVTTRVRQADQSGGIAVGEFYGIETLELYETLEDRTYVTRIYCYEGQVRELFSEAKIEFLPSDGECLLEADRMSFSLENGFLTAEIQRGEECLSLSLFLRSEEAVYEK